MRHSADLIIARRVSRPRAVRLPNGFTLIEMLTAIALIVLLMVGVSAVFRSTSETVGAGQALSAAVRDGRAFRAVLEEDLRGAVGGETPAFIIRSERRAAFRSKNDKLTDVSWNTAPFDPLAATADEVDAEARSFNTDPVDPTDNYAPAPPILTARSRRTDRLAFFYRGEALQRITGSNGRFIDAGGANEAWVTYGHVRKPDTTGAMVDPGPWDREAGAYVLDDVNRDNSFSAEWSLARHQILLVPLAQLNAMNAALAPEDPVQYYQRQVGALGVPLSPLAPDSTETAPAAPPPGYSQGDDQARTGRFDLGEGSIAELASDLVTHPLAPDDDPGAWFNILTGSRISANQYATAPLTPAAAAKAASIALSNCSGFIVEFAGDYVTQDAATGAVTAAVPDEQLDYIPIWTDRDGNGVIDAEEVQGAKTRWYGYPRDTTGDGKILGTGELPTVGDWIEIGDVLPLNAVIESLVPAEPRYAFERNTTGLGATLGLQPDYAVVGAVPPDAQYVAAWGGPDATDTGPTGRNPLPQLLRIIIALDDPQTRLPEAQTFEYVLSVPRQ